MTLGVPITIPLHDYGLPWTDEIDQNSNSDGTNKCGGQTYTIMDITDHEVSWATLISSGRRLAGRPGRQLQPQTYYLVLNPPLGIQTGLRSLKLVSVMDRFSHITDFVTIDVHILDPAGCEPEIIPTDRIVPDVVYAWGSEPH